jgi:phospholipid transport system substrate-binding protein
MSKTRRIAFVPAAAVLALCFGSILQSRAADPPTTPRQLTEKVVAEALAILRDPKLSAAERRDKIQQIGYDNLSFDVMARLSLGRYYKNLTDAQKSEYADAFKQHVTNTYRHTTDHYTDEDIKVTGDRKEADGDWTVMTQIVDSKGAQVVKVDYRLRLKDNQWKVIDLTIDGVSLVSNFRSQFQDIMTNGGIEKLLQLLREKNAANDK